MKNVIVLSFLVITACSERVGRVGGIGNLPPPVGLYPSVDTSNINPDPGYEEVVNNESPPDMSQSNTPDMEGLPDMLPDMLEVIPDLAKGCRDYKGNGIGHHYGLCPHHGDPREDEDKDE